MRKNRHRLAQCLIKHHLLGGIGNVVRAANDVADPHVDIIGHHAQVIGRGAVGTQQHDIFDFIIRELHPSQHCIIEICASCFRHGKADCGRLPCSSAPGRLFTWHSTTDAFIFCRTPISQRRGTLPLQLLLRAEAVVCMSGRDQPRRSLPVQIHPLRLKIRTLIPIQSQPAHAPQDALHHLARGALDIRVLNTQNECPMVMSREQPVK